MTDNPTLETLEARLERLINLWKLAQETTDSDVRIVADRQLAEFVALHPELLTVTSPTYYSPDGLEGTLIPQLLALPDEIRRLQEIFDGVDQGYQQAVAIFGISSLAKSHFIGKDGLYHAASNDIERRLALDMVPSETEELIEMTNKRADALRALQQAKTRLECARLIIQLVCRDGRR